MPRIERSSLVVLVLGLLAGSAGAQEPIRLARTPDISPDGKSIAFSYLGDIWKVETIGGIAQPITSHPAHDLFPVFSPDGKSIAFSSNRHGSYDVFVVSSHGGRPRRLTFDSASDMVSGWSPDGKQVLFASSRSTSYPPSYELYTVPVEGGMARRVTAAEGKEGVFSPQGDLLAYVRGPGTWYRKGYRGSANDDIWIGNADGTHNRRLTAFEGQDTSPMWSADGRTLYYVSEFFGTPANIVRLPVHAPPSTKPEQLTHHTEDGVRRARISGDGSWIVYECGPDLWVVSTRPGSTPRQLAIEVNADDKTNPEEVRTFTRGATEFAVSPDEKQVAFAVHGKLFRMPVSSKAKVTQLTDGPSYDHGIAWAPDASKIIFISDRDGHEDLYLLEANDPDHPKFVDAHRFKVTRLTSSREPEFGVGFAPDGKRVAFLRAGKLWTMNPDGGDPKAVVNDVHVIDYEWSPDSKWIVYSRQDGSFASELYVVPATGPTEANPARNVTRYATFNAGVTWSADGKKLVFLSERRGPANLYVLDLQKPAAEGYKPFFPGPAIDWEDIHLRARPVVPVAVAEAAISPDGSRVAFRDAKESDLWVASTTGGQITRLTTGRQSPHHIQWSKRKTPVGGTLDLVYFLDGGGNLCLARASEGEARPGSRGAVTIPFRVKMTVRTEELYTEMFDQSWRYLDEHFYDTTFHGHKWDEVKKKYRPLVKHVALKEDLYSLLYLMMGELNASHLGISGFTTLPDEMTADLGLIFNDSYRGKGLKIAEVLKRGPADKRGVNLKPGDVILAIDGVELTPGVEVSRLLNGKVNEPVLLQVSSNPDAPQRPGVATPGRSDRKVRRVEIQAASRSRIAELMYDRWVERNARRVAELSKGKLGYIHIPSMDEEGVDRFVRSLYSDNFDKEAIVLDVRFNGGGNTHDEVLNYLGARTHTFFRQRDGGEGPVLRPIDRKWTKPLVLLINNRSYSDAEIFPSAVRTLGLGKLVGQPTGGFVIGTRGVRLVDGSFFRVPRVGVYTTKGVNMEKEGVQPDVLVEPHPDQLARGQDSQLDKAVEVLQAEVLASKKKQTPNVAARPPEGKAGTPLPPVTPVINPR